MCLHHRGHAIILASTFLDAAICLPNMLDAKHKSSYRVQHEQAPSRQARPNPLHAVRGLLHAVDQPRCGRVDQHRSKLLVDAGEACVAIHDETVRNVKAKRVQCDEIWSFCYAKEKNVATAKAAPDGAGDVWTWTALDADTKLIVSYFVGDRCDADRAMPSWTICAARLANRVQLTTDGHRAYLEAVEGAFGADIDYAMLVKIYTATRRSDAGSLQPRRMHRREEAARRGQPRPEAHFHRPMSSARTSPCACTCAASPA